jgi:hypothetical protein
MTKCYIKKRYEQHGKILKLKEFVKTFCLKTFAVLFLFSDSREEFDIYRNVIIKERNWFWSSIQLFDASILSQLVAIARTRRSDNTPGTELRVMHWPPGLWYVTIFVKTVTCTFFICCVHSVFVLLQPRGCRDYEPSPGVRKHFVWHAVLPPA